jgi:hypothetical protein
VSKSRYDLGIVKKLVREWMDGEDKGWFSAPSCSVDYVIHVFECTQVEAEETILVGILMLESSNFIRRIYVWGSVADEYGLQSYLGHNWYIKFVVEDGELEQISFHPSEKEMRLANGRAIRPSIRSDEMPPWRK